MLTGTCVFRHFINVQRIHTGKSETENSAPVIWYLQELDVHFFVDGHWTIAERHSLAKAVHPTGDEPVLVQSDILAVNGVESQWRQIRINYASAGFRCCKK